MPNIKKTRIEKQATDQQVVEGIQKDLQTTTAFILGGTSYTAATLVTFILSHIAAANAVLTTKAAWQNAIKTYKGLDTQATVVLRDLKNLVIATFGSTSPKLADFGYAPRKVTVLTPAQKAAAAEKRAATRKARGTLGPKKKLAITGATAAAAAAANGATGATTSNAAATTPPTPATAAAPVAATPTVTVNVLPATAAATPAPTSPSTQTAATPAATATTKA